MGKGKGKGRARAPAMARREGKRRQSKNQDPVNCLPDDVIRHILSKLGLRDIARVSTASRRWRQLCLSLPFLNLDLQAFDIYASSALQESNVQYPVQYLRVYHSYSTGTDSGRPMASMFEDERSYEVFLENLKRKCIAAWREWNSKNGEVEKEEKFLELVEICWEMVFGELGEFGENRFTFKRPCKSPNLKFFSQLKEIEIELRTEHLMHGLTIIYDALIHATELKEMTIVRPLHFVSGADKAYKVWRRSSHASSYVFVKG